MGLPIVQEATRPVPREELLRRLRENVKAAPRDGVSNLGKPPWLTIRPPSAQYYAVRQRLRAQGLVTVCQESHCPNMSECWSAGTATFMILGDTCTRACRFCAVKSRKDPAPPDPAEPERIVRAVQEMGLRYVVLTCVDRDDLADGGAAHWALVVRALKTACPDVRVEALIGDFQGDVDLVRIVVDSGVDVLAHNLETTRRLTPTVRDRRASYDQSLAVLRAAKRCDPQLRTKTSFMVGLGETYEELLQGMDDARDAGVDILTFGQYLQPSSWHLPVECYLSPEEFARLEQGARARGFSCASGPFVRSSYRAGELFNA